MCRKAGLERKRRCGWMPAEAAGEETIVWARRGTALNTCPRSYITPQSTAWLEAYYVREKLGGVRLEEMAARDVEAWLVLEGEEAAERNHAERYPGRATASV